MSSAAVHHLSTAAARIPEAFSRRGPVALSKCPPPASGRSQHRARLGTERRRADHPARLAGPLHLLQMEAGAANGAPRSRYAGAAVAVCSASTRRCKSCCRSLPPPTPGSNAPTARRRSAAAARSTACWRAMSATRGRAPYLDAIEAAGRDRTRLVHATTPCAALLWTPAYRVIPTRFPAVNLFDRVASPETSTRYTRSKP